MRVGYARVRPDPLDAQGQQEILLRHGIEQFHSDLGRTGGDQLSTGFDAAVAAAGAGSHRPLDSITTTLGRATA